MAGASTIQRPTRQRNQRGSAEARQPPGDGLPGQRMFRERSVQPESFGGAAGSPTAPAA